MMKRLMVGLGVVSAVLIGWAQDVGAKEEAGILLQTGHADVVTSVAFSPDGKYIASGSSDKTIKLWKKETGNLIRTLEGHSGSVNSIAFSPDERYIASGSSDKTVKIWDVSTGEIIKTFNDEGEIWSIAFSPNSEYVAAGWYRETVALWEIKTGKCVIVPRPSITDCRIHSMIFSPDSKYVLCTTNEGIKLLDVATFHLIRTIEIEGTIEKWDRGTPISTTGSVTAYVSAEAGGRISSGASIYSAAFSPDGESIVSGGNDGIVRLWKTEGKLIRAFEGHSKSVRFVSFNSDGSYILSAGADKTIKVWNTGTGELVRTLEGHSDSVNSAAFSRDGYIVSGSSDKTIQLWGTETGNPIKIFEGHTSGVNSVDSSFDRRKEDSGTIIWGRFKPFKVIDPSLCEIVLQTEHTDCICSIAFSPDGEYIASGGSNTIRLWQTKTGKQIKIFEGHIGYVNSIAFSPDGRYIASGGDDRTIRLWGGETGKQIRVFKGHTSKVNSVAFIPDADGKYIASGGDSTVQLWETETGKQIRTFGGHLGYVNSVTFSPDGRYITSGSDDRTIRLWKIESGKQVRVFKGDVSSVAFSPDGKYIVSGSWKTVQLWETETGKQIQTFGGHTGYVNSVAFSPDGIYIVSGGSDKTIRLLEIGNPVKTFTGHTSRVNSVAFSPNNGIYIASGSKDGSVRLWNTKTGDLLLTTFGFIDGEWVSYTPQYYYDSSLQGGKYITFHRGNEVYSFEQLAGYLYHPEIITETIKKVSDKSLLKLHIKDLENEIEAKEDEIKAQKKIIEKLDSEYEKGEIDYSRYLKSSKEYDIKLIQLENKLKELNSSIPKEKGE